MPSKPAVPFEAALDSATAEGNTEENWDRILEVCDYVKNGQRKPQELLEQILKRLRQTQKPRVQMHTLTLLDAAVKNCGQEFRHQLTSRDFMNNLKQVIENSKTESIIRNRLGCLLKQWCDDSEFKKPEYDMLPSLYKELTQQKNYTFYDDSSMGATSNSAGISQTSTNRNNDQLLAKKEEDDFAKAIALSIQETTQQKSKQQQVQNSIYPTVQSTTTGGSDKKVKALYDFEAAEDNEVTFKAGDILTITDDSDQHWWKGINNGVEGLFPANFVTKNLNQVIETIPIAKISDDFQKQQHVDQQRVVEMSKEQVVIDERLIDRCLNMLQNADPTGEFEADTQEILMLEDQCYAMGPLIDHELEKVDRKHVQLEDLNKNLREAMDLYHRLMEEGRIRAVQAKTTAAAALAATMYSQPPSQQQQYYPSMQQQPIYQQPYAIPSPQHQQQQYIPQQPYIQQQQVLPSQQPSHQQLGGVIHQQTYYGGTQTGNENPTQV